ncbi:MAG: M48 family metallopeptidase [Chitinophagaceae bacterium]|nr:M48 family metallopeptidase [Chitinophagaceae bacterium]
MKRFLVVTSMALTLFACSRNAITGRKQLQLYNETDIQAMAVQEYRQFLTQNKVVSAGANKDAEMVRRVGQRISTAITAFYKGKGLGKELEGYQWEYNLVDSKDVNAWCMPGGKIVVYTGLLPITQNEAALAAVVGHEVAHALAKHGNERMSQTTAQQLGGVALSVAVANKTPEAQNLFMTAYGLGTTVGGILPFSRKHELEADKFGLIYAALAGYNPQEAIPLWERMAAASGGGAPPEFLSTHPAEQTRINELRKMMPEALKYYKPMKR